MSERSLAVRITGLVQGVGFRAWTRDEARRLGLSGWVVNHEAGHVDAVFTGPGGDLAEMVALCRTGPVGSRVDHVDARSVDGGAGREPPEEAVRF